MSSLPPTLQTPGSNQCVRPTCQLHFSTSTQHLPTCFIHTQDLVSRRTFQRTEHQLSDDCKHLPDVNDLDSHEEWVYSCCQKPKGSHGCQRAPHLPTYRWEKKPNTDSSSSSTSPSSASTSLFHIDSAAFEPVKIVYPPIDLTVGRWASAQVDCLSTVKSSPVSPSPSTSIDANATWMSSLGSPVPRVGDEIVVCGQYFHTGCPVVLWTDVGGYDHYRVETRFTPYNQSSWADSCKNNPELTTPNRYGIRDENLTPAQIEQVRGGGWDLKLLQSTVDQVVLHYDELGLSQQCFKMLQDTRDLSIHFMLDLDGTLYQAVDLKEKAWQATISNNRSIGIEIANIGAYDPSQPGVLSQWYAQDSSGQTYISIPSQYGNGGIRTPGFVGRPARNDPVTGNVQNQNLIQFDYTPQQYVTLTKLLATLSSIFPQVKLDYPRDSTGKLIPHQLTTQQWTNYKGILGHYHVQLNKIDPGPAMQWDKVISGAQQIVQQAQTVKQQQQQQQQQQQH